VRLLLDWFRASWILEAIQAPGWAAVMALLGAEALIISLTLTDSRFCSDAAKRRELAFSYLPSAAVGLFRLGLGQAEFFNVIIFGVVIALVSVTLASGFHPVVLGEFQWGQNRAGRRGPGPRAWMMLIALLLSLLMTGLVFVVNFEPIGQQ
jgi:hypothetical protein